MEEPTVSMLALRGFALVSTEELDGELVTVIETTEVVSGCPECGTVARPKDRRIVTLRDLPAGGRPVRLAWRKRIWSCPDPDCPKKTWTERSWLAAPRRVLTERARSEICRRVGEEITSVAEEARHFGVGWHCAWAAVSDVGVGLVDDPERTAGVTQVGVDETVYLHARRRRRRVLVTGVVDVESGRLLDVFEGREAKALRRWMAEMPSEWLSMIEVVSVDPHEGYRSAVVNDNPVTGRPSPWRDVTVVVDPFHIVRLGNEAVDQVPPAGPTGVPRTAGLERRSPVPHPPALAPRCRVHGRARLGATPRSTKAR
jgi:transposase